MRAVAYHEAGHTVVERRLRARTEQSIAANWHCVEILAAALLARQRLTGAEVRAALRRPQ